jgi:large subunit ribosomal protein L19
MRNRIIESVEAGHYKKDVPKFEIGDKVSVGVKIIEGTKERVQPFVGVVIGCHGRGMNSTFTVRRIVNNEGVERVFPLHSPRIVNVEVVGHGKVRRAKLFYLRDRVGKSRKLRERRVTGDARDDGGDSVPGTPARMPRSGSEREVVATV